MLKKCRFDYIENSKSTDYEMYIRFVRFQLSENNYILGLAAFHSKKENSILQEIFARLIMYNFSIGCCGKGRHVGSKLKQLQIKETPSV